MMKTKRFLASVLALAFVGGTISAPLSVEAQSLSQLSRQRQKTKNEWRNLAIGGGAVALYGLLKGDPTVSFLGAAGALYSLHRYEQDRKSQSAIDRARAAAFSRKYMYRNGKRYVRKTVRKNGKTYYQFVRG